MSYKKTAKVLAFVLSFWMAFSFAFTSGATSYQEESGGYTIEFEDADAIDSTVRERILNIFQTVYPEMAETYNQNAPKTVYCRVDTEYDGVAYTVGNRVVVSANWLNQYPTDVDCLTHEFFHVVQSYSTYDPIWLIEGMTDYARYKYGLYNDLSEWSLPGYQESQNYTDSYRVTARFLLWAEKYVNPELVSELNDLFYNNCYSSDAWVTLTGKSVDDLWAEYASNPDITRLVGDADLDGIVSVSDVVKIRKAIMDGDGQRLFDVNFDGLVTVSDVITVRKFIMKS